MNHSELSVTCVSAYPERVVDDKSLAVSAPIAPRRDNEPRSLSCDSLCAMTFSLTRASASQLTRPSGGENRTLVRPRGTQAQVRQGAHCRVA